MKPSALYSNTIIASQSSKLLDHNRVRRMIAADDFDSAAHVLFECGYDETVITYSEKNEDAIINKEMERCVKLFKQLCPDERVLTCILTKFDYHNARIFYKSRFDVVNTDDGTYPSGNIDKQKLEKALNKKKYTSLPPHMKIAIETLDTIASPTAHEIDITFNKNQTAEIKDISAKIKSDSVRQYFLTDNEDCLKNTKDVFCLEMLLKWFILKQQELKIVKTILMSKKLGLKREKIRELLKGWKW